MGVWHMPYTCLPYAVHVSALCQTPVHHMPDTNVFFKVGAEHTHATPEIYWQANNVMQQSGG